MRQIERVEAVRRRLRELQIDERKAEMAGPPCTYCIHYLARPEDTDPRIKDKGPFCGHLAYVERRHDPTTGRISEIISMDPAIARADDGLCGHEALLFEPVTTSWKVVRWVKYEAIPVAGMWVIIGGVISALYGCGLLAG
jgi:hypothetical protein